MNILGYNDKHYYVIVQNDKILISPFANVSMSYSANEYINVNGSILDFKTYDKEIKFEPISEDEIAQLIMEEYVKSN